MRRRRAPPRAAPVPIGLAVAVFVQPYFTIYHIVKLMASLKDNRKVKFNWTKEPTFKPQDRAVPCYQLRTIRPSCCQSPPKLTGRRPTLGQVSTGRHGPRHGPRGINYNMKTA